MAFITNKHNTATGLKLFFVRHAESTNNIACHDNFEAYEQLRSHDPELSPQGHDQAASLAQYIKQPENLGDICESII